MKKDGEGFKMGAFEGECRRKLQTPRRGQKHGLLTVKSTDTIHCVLCVNAENEREGGKRKEKRIDFSYLWLLTSDKFGIA